MRRAFVGLLVAASLMASAVPAEAVPRYGSKWTNRDGWIVWVRGDSRWSKYHCSWYAQGTRWTFAHRLPPYDYQWTTSDRGNWGDVRPRNLECDYRRI